MPNPKLGTVTMDVTKAVAEQKAGKVEFRIDKASIIVHAPVGKTQFWSAEAQGQYSRPDRLHKQGKTIGIKKAPTF